MNVLTYGEWRDTCDTVHMLLQMMGKAKLQSMDPQPEWKQVVLDADANGFTTGLIPFGADGFEIKLNIADAEMAAMTAAGDCARFPIEECVSVSELYGRFTAMLENIGHPIAINTVSRRKMHTESPVRSAEHRARVRCRGCTALLPSVPVRARGFERVRSAVSREEDPAFAVLGHLRHDDRAVLRKALSLRTHGFHSRARRLRRAVRGIRVLAGRRCYERSFLLRTGLSVC